MKSFFASLLILVAFTLPVKSQSYDVVPTEDSYNVVPYDYYAKLNVNIPKGLSGRMGFVGSNNFRLTVHSTQPCMLYVFGSSPFFENGKPQFFKLHFPAYNGHNDNQCVFSSDCSYLTLDEYYYVFETENRRVGYIDAKLECDCDEDNRSFKGTIGPMSIICPTMPDVDYNVFTSQSNGRLVLLALDKYSNFIAYSDHYDKGTFNWGNNVRLELMV